MNHSEKAPKVKTLTSYIACHQVWLHLYIDRGISRVSTKTKSATETTTVMTENAAF